MWKAKFIECLASEAAGALPANATDDEIAVRNHFNHLRMKGSKTILTIMQLPKFQTLLKQCNSFEL